LGVPSTRRWRADGNKATLRGSLVDVPPREDAIETALSNKLAQRAAAREAQRKAAAKEIAEFTGEFLNAARKCFELIDKDGGGTLSTAEIVKAVKEDKVSNAASYDRAPFNLRGSRGLCDRPSRHHFLSTRRK
jgi:hypothetical protein